MRGGGVIGGEGAEGIVFLDAEHGGVSGCLGYGGSLGDRESEENQEDQQQHRQSENQGGYDLTFFVLAAPLIAPNLAILLRAYIAQISLKQATSACQKRYAR